MTNLYNDIKEQAIKEALKLPQNFIDELDSIKYMKEQKDFHKYSNSDMKKYLIEVCMACLDENFQKAIVRLSALQMTLNIPQYLINKDYDIIKTRIGDKNV